MSIRLRRVCFFKLDTLFQSILACCEGLSASQVVQELTDQYEAEEIVEAIEELAQAGLISDGALPVVSDVPTTEGVAACGVSQTDRLQVSLHVSHTCNIQCAYCFAHGGDYGGKAMLMQPDVAEQAIRWIVTEAQVFGRCQIDFFGGEPLLNFSAAAGAGSVCQISGRTVGCAGWLWHCDQWHVVDRRDEAILG